MNKTYDICVVGGGIVGLWTARHLLAAGARVVLIERDRCGAGASGGVLGALMAHAPDNWNAKKQFQFDALTELPAVIEELETATGLGAGYARCGRLMPIRRETFRAQAQRRAAAAEQVWHAGARSFAYHIEQQAPADNWLDRDCAPLGVINDTLAARIDPVRYMAALRHAVDARGALRENCTFERFDAPQGKVYCSGITAPIRAGQVVLTAGYQTFDIVARMINLQLGGGIKGQAALLRCPQAAGQPLIYDDGVYIVPHDDGLCAVGSTSEKQWDDPSRPDMDRTDFLDRARELCPPLREAPVLRRWAGVRPRCLRTDPMIGRLQPETPIWVATGGYKITFGIAHRMARRISEEMSGSPATVALPPTFEPQHHLEAAANSSS